MGCRGVDFEAFGANFFAAGDAVAILAVVDAAEGLFDLDEFGGTLAFRGLRHGLLLQGIYARQAPDALLVERHRFARVRAARAQLLQLGAPRKQNISGLAMVHRLVIVRS